MQNTGEKSLIGLILTAVTLGACGPSPEPEAQESFLPAAPAPAENCGDVGHLLTTLYGALEGEIRWTAETLACEGMPRRGDEGARLRFAGTVGALDVAIIIALPDLEPGSPGNELPSNVTLIEEGSGRFFSTAGLESCWTDVDDQRALPETPGVYTISGTLYCIAPLGEVNGNSSVSFRELQFTGLIDWGSA